MKMDSFLRIAIMLFFTPCIQITQAQEKLVSEPVLHMVSRLAAQLPANINEAYRHYDIIKPLFDSLEQRITAAYPALANKLDKRSAKLNAMINENAADAKLLLLPPNQNMVSFFIAEWDRMDALERVFNQKVRSFYGSEVYQKQKQTYLPEWDSVYKVRRPALLNYRDGIFKLVQAEMAYLKLNGKMFASTDEDERIQWVEAELGVLQKLVLLAAKYKKVVMIDGAEKVDYCNRYPYACTGKISKT